jgi:hypothetical protein
MKLKRKAAAGGWAVKRVGPQAEKIGGKSGYDHDGQDTIMDWRMIDCLRNGLPVEQNVYDAAAWSALVELTCWSSRHRSQPVDVPEFTGGSWKTNRSLMDLARSCVRQVQQKWTGGLVVERKGKEIFGRGLDPGGV